MNQGAELQQFLFVFAPMRLYCFVKKMISQVLSSPHFVSYSFIYALEALLYLFIQLSYVVLHASVAGANRKPNDEAGCNLPTVGMYIKKQPKVKLCAQGILKGPDVLFQLARFFYTGLP